MPRPVCQDTRDSAESANSRKELARLRACLDDILSERDDALFALDEARLEQELGLPCWALGAVQAHIARCVQSLAILLAELEASLNRAT